MIHQSSYVFRGTPYPGISADAGDHLQAYRNRFGARSSSLEDMIEKIRGYPGQYCDLFLGDFLLDGLHGLLNLVVKKHSVNKKAKKK